MKRKLRAAGERPMDVVGYAGLLAARVERTRFELLGRLLGYAVPSTFVAVPLTGLLLSATGTMARFAVWAVSRIGRKKPLPYRDQLCRAQHQRLAPGLRSHRDALRHRAAAVPSAPAPDRPARRSVAPCVRTPRAPAPSPA